MPHPPALCSTCASSILPSSLKPASAHPRSAPQTHTTPCCGRPICANCLQRNPRLRGYNPCLGCLGGVGAVRVERREEDIWVLGGEDDEDEDADADTDGEGEGEGDKDTGDPGKSSGAGEEKQGSSAGGSAAPDDPPPVPEPQRPASDHPPTPYRHLIKPHDTLLGLAMGYKVDGYALCRLNSLPPSTLRTTPHLLHTRTYLLLPPTAALPHAHPHAQQPRPPSPEPAARKRERAIKRFQCVTKEVDWDVARAYVALEDSDVASLASSVGEREGGGKAKASASARAPAGAEPEPGREGRAVERYLDDETWEREERGAGRAGLTGAPWFEPRGAGRQAESSSSSGSSGWLGWLRGDAGVMAKAG